MLKTIDPITNRKDFLYDFLHQKLSFDFVYVKKVETSFNNDRCLDLLSPYLEADWTNRWSDWISVREDSNLLSKLFYRFWSRFFHQLSYCLLPVLILVQQLFTILLCCFCFFPCVGFQFSRALMNCWMLKYCIPICLLLKNEIWRLFTACVGESFLLQMIFESWN